MELNASLPTDKKPMPAVAGVKHPRTTKSSGQGEIVGSDYKADDFLCPNTKKKSSITLLSSSENSLNECDVILE